MTIRNLGDWSPLDLDSDPVYADPEAIDKAQKRYQGIAETIDDAVAKLQKIVDAGSGSLAGQYVQGLQSGAGSLKDRLTKAGRRYHDVADQIKLYQSDLGTALTETAGALTDAQAATEAQTKAAALPDPQKNPDGSIPASEQQKQTDKNKATSDADTALTAAKTRLNNALGALNTAGKRFGDAVNCKNYDDGLTDSWKDKLDAVMAKISQIFAIIGMVLAALAILIPGVDAIVLAAVVAGAVTLAANIVLYKDGKGSLADVILGAVGLGLAGLGSIASVIGKGIAAEAKGIASAAGGGGRGGQGGFQMVPLRPPGAAGAAGRPAPNFSRPFGANNPPPARPVPNFSRPFGPGNTFTPGGAVPNFSRPFGPGNAFTPGRPLGPGASGGAPAGNAATEWQNLSDWFNNPATNWIIGKLGGTTPEVGFWGSAENQIGGAGKFWGTLFTDPAQFGKDFGAIIAGIKGPIDLQGVVGAAGLGTISPLWYVWGGLNGAFGFGAGFIYTGGRLTGWIPAVNPPGVVPS